jgi:hypothetical protein
MLSCERPIFFSRCCWAVARTKRRRPSGTSPLVVDRHAQGMVRVAGKPGCERPRKGVRHRRGRQRPQQPRPGPWHPCSVTSGLRTFAPGPTGPVWVGFTTVGAGPIGEFAGGLGVEDASLGTTAENALEGIAGLLTSTPGPIGLLCEPPGPADCELPAPLNPPP